MPRYILLDRDGVINRRVVDGYVTSWSQFEFLPGALEALRLLAENDYSAIVISNQACVGKGLLTLEGLNEITDHFVAEVEKHGGRIERMYYCPHRTEDRCYCRKPLPGLLIRAQRDYGFSFSATFLVGDCANDAVAAHRVGCPFILISPAWNINGQGASLAQAVGRDLYWAVLFVLDHAKGQPAPTEG